MTDDSYKETYELAKQMLEAEIASTERELIDLWNEPSWRLPSWLPSALHRLWKRIDTVSRSS